MSCSFCTKDLYLFKPLLQKIASLEESSVPKQALAELEQKVARLEQLLEQGLHSPALAEQPSELSEVTTGTAIGLAAWVLRTLRMLGRYLLLPLALLLLSHYLMDIVFDTHVLYLRLVSLAVPLPFGLLVMRERHAGFRHWAVLSALMALGAVFAMSFDTSLFDHTSVLPQSRLELREFIEFSFSIWGSYLAGMMLGYFVHPHRTVHPQHFSYKLVQMVKKTDMSPEDIQKRAENLQGFFGTIVSLGTSALAIYTGLKSVIGN
ncbi:hypothetical protein FHW67_002209 [Herbaspirillum sp. Sphag1AN]|uniref:hypothetical protein n=1 Tax=unclassified Herbaspirillum TaxID=2624150 RepID=UPI001607AFCC|nr:MULTISPECIES: hypothetical protein [unclassified Herbaspirillum]MBB3212921.1 hypothetical protein [Herbaspirillum sp. Sphag1AN]MBB3246118.1 hypothetical protein [Herbaspirillum sp. Sphag64]